MPGARGRSGGEEVERWFLSVIWVITALAAAPLAAVEPSLFGPDRPDAMPLLTDADRHGILAGLALPRLAAGQERLEGLGDPESELEPFPVEAGGNPVRRLGVDLVALVRAPADFDRRDWGRFALAAAALAGVAALDDPIHDAAWSGEPSGTTFAEQIRPLGQEAGLALMALAWSYGEVANRPRLAAIGQDGIEATILAAGIVTPALKQLVGRSRPRSGLGSSSFSGSESFPSGEATQAFAMAAVVAAHSSSRLVDTLAYSTAALIGWQRIRLDAHWASDVVAGALIGTTIGRWVVRRNHPEVLSRTDFTWSPLIDRGSYGLSLRWRL